MIKFSDPWTISRKRTFEIIVCTVPVYRKVLGGVCDVAYVYIGFQMSLINNGNF